MGPIPATAQAGLRGLKEEMAHHGAVKLVAILEAEDLMENLAYAHPQDLNGLCLLGGRLYALVAIKAEMRRLKRKIATQRAEPNPEMVTATSGLPDSANRQGALGRSLAMAVVSGQIGATCSGDEEHGTDNRQPGTGKWACDSSTITRGESTENEMVLLTGRFYKLEQESYA